MDSSRRLALSVLGRYRPGRSTISTLLNDCLERAGDTPDKGFTRDLVWGVVRYMNALDWALERFVKKPRDLSPRVRDILRVGAYQILFEHQRIPAYAAVNESVDAARAIEPRAAGLVNAVLRSLIRAADGEKTGFPREKFDTEIGWLSVIGAHPAWLIERWRHRMGDEDTAALCAANNAAPLLTLRVNTVKTTREDLLRDCAAQGITVEPTEHSPDGICVTSRCELSKMPGYSAGHFVVQDEASQLVARFADPRPGDSIIDVCCGSGIKTTHLAQIAGNAARVVAIDTDERKLARARSLAAAMGVTGVEFRAADIRTVAGLTARTVVVDAPCSGLGVIRRKPDIKWNRTEDDIARRYPALQSEILTACAPLVEQNGTLVYATCSTEPDENEMVIERFLSAQPQFTLTDARRTWPHRDAMDGFYMAKLLRKSE